MIVAFDATSIGSGLGGDETMVRSFLTTLLPQLGEGDRLTVLAARGAVLPVDVEDHPAVQVHRVVRRSGVRHFAWTLPRWLTSLKSSAQAPDAVVTNTHAPLFAHCPVALTITDLSFLRVPQAYPRSTRMRLRWVVRWQLRKAASIMTISEFCKADIRRAYGLPSDRVNVVPLTIEPSYPIHEESRAVLAQRGVRSPFILYLGNLHPRKNLPAAIRAFAEARERHPQLAEVQFVLAGSPWFGSSAEAKAAAQLPTGAILFLDRVTDSEREVLLRDAMVLVYVSTFEGFGLPPLEAMSRGLPVLAANATAIPETCGKAALLVDPGDTSAMSTALVRILTDDQLRAAHIAAGHRRVEHFTAERTGTALYAAIRSACQ